MQAAQPMESRAALRVQVRSRYASERAATQSILGTIFLRREPTGPRRRSKPMQAKRFEELKATGLLPSPTGIGLEILRLTRDENVSAAQIGRVIQADPALTGRTPVR